jgi:hypothetical protein
MRLKYKRELRQLRRWYKRRVILHRRGALFLRPNYWYLMYNRRTECITNEELHLLLRATVRSINGAIMTITPAKKMHLSEGRLLRLITV